MILEILSMLIVFAAGCMFVRTFDVKGWELPAFGFFAGLSIQVVVGTIQVVVGLPTHPYLNLSLTLLLSLAWFVICFRRGVDLSFKPIPSVISIAVIILLVMFFSNANTVNWHTDSFRYLLAGNLIAGGNYSYVNLGSSIIEQRLLAVPIIHAPANLQGEYYLHSVFPLMALSTVMILAWFLSNGLRGKLNNRLVWQFTALGVLLLITNNRFIFHAFYINGHLLFATLFLIIAGCSWLLVSDPKINSKFLLAMQALAIPVLVVTRPEGAIAAGLALLPLLLSSRIAWIKRAIILVVLGVSTLAWQFFVILKHYQAVTMVPVSVSSMLAIGVLAVLAIPLLRWLQLERGAKYILATTEVGLWAILLFFTVRPPVSLVGGQVNLFRDSVAATIENVVYNAGAWGYSLMVLAFLVVVVIALTDIPDRIFLRFPLTTFIPFSFLLAFLRGSPYRIGDGDSLNRSWIHIIPLAILFIVSAAATERWGLPRINDKVPGFLKIKQKDPIDSGFEI